MRTSLNTKQSNEVHEILGDKKFINGTFETRKKIIHQIMMEFFKVGKEGLPDLRDCDLRTVLYSLMSMHTLQEALDFNFLCYAEKMKEENEKDSNFWSAEEKSAYYYISDELKKKLKKQGIY